MAETPKTEYNRAQFEAAYRALVQCSHAIRHIEVTEVTRWIKRIIEDDAETMDAPRREGLQKLLKLLDAFQKLRETMKETGVPRQPPVATVLPSEKAQ